VWVAAAHVVMAIVSQGARFVLVSRKFGTTVRAQVRATKPGVCAVLGVLALAGPVRLLLPHGLPTLILLGLLGVSGAVGGVMLGARGTLGEVRELVGMLRPRAGA
jgi:hypothetical protein